MKFFAPEVCDTFDTYEPFQEVYGAYRQHLETLKGVLPEHILELAEPSGMEDGLVVRVDHDRERRALRLVLRCGHLQMGYYNLVLIYDDAELLPVHDVALAKIARSTESQRIHGCDLAYHEVDATADGRIDHRFIFHATEYYFPLSGNWIWFAVRCRTLRWRREPRLSRRLPSLQDRYPGGPVD